jgi:hypothetical protein
MRGFLSLIVCLPLAGCLAGASQGRSSTTVVRDTGVPGLERTTYESQQSGSYIGGQIPMMMPGGGYGYGGYGGMSVNGPSCVLHPDNCAVIQTATVIQPMTVVSNGSSGGGATVGTVDTSDLEARIERLEGSTQKLKGAAKLSLKRSCQIITGNPEVIKDADERRKILEACQKVLNANPNPNTEEK